MIKKIFFLLAIFILSCSTTFAASDSAVIDTAKILNETQIQTLTSRINKLENEHHIKIGINFLKTIGGQNIDTVANERLRKYYSGGENGGIILVVVMDSRKWNIAINEKMKQKISNYSDIAYRNEDFYNELHDNDFYGASIAYLNAIEELLIYYEENGMPYDRSDEFDPMALGLAILLAIVCGFGIRSWLIGSMSNVRFASEASDYLKRNSIRLTEERDTYLFTNVSRRPKSKSSNHSSGRSSGGGSSGGGSF